MLRGERPTIFGDGEQTRDFTYIANPIHANLLARSAPASKVAGKVFNIAGGEQISLNRAYAALQELTGFREPPIFAAERVGDVKHALADITRARQDLGYEVQVPFIEGLQRTVEWYREQVPQAVRA
jgi:UDP-glucose 4-epimerase